MLNKFFRLISPKNRILHAAERIAKKVDKLSDYFRGLSDEELRKQSDNLVAQVAAGKSLDYILILAFGIIREVIFRETNEYAYLVQLEGAFVVHCGDFAEIVTGEGKTLTLLIVAYLNALKKEGVHIVTVNEYLARRDADYAQRILNRLGLTVGCNTASISGFMKKKMFACDITYTTNSELWFDYLRDNMVQSYDDKKNRSLNFAIVDEGDSILIDEARTPLIISGQPRRDFSMYVDVNHFVEKLTPEDYKIEPESRSPSLIIEGTKKAEKYFNVSNIFNIENSDLIHKIINALMANFVFRDGKEYIVRENEILLVDQFTGRILHGRSYNSGLQQAIKAKERVKIEPENLIIATITYQSFFRLYKKLAAVSGTAITESEEFLKIYNMVVVPIPTNKPLIRKDFPDFIFGNAEAK
ncbi:SecA cross-linking domain protein [Dictyocaulus viviparus]|uniref:SecA cross-linking domain protein n=1 Tax=Dictyocaulus viviparus TaxID=29172 RepID=A0A0D8XBY2_DICVI|nr:SecA cross-linking domain protein [Dictyocaulus viviparus]